MKKRRKEKLSDGKSIGGSGNRLSEQTIKKLQEYYRNAIRRNVNRTAKTADETNNSLDSMKDSIMAVLYHCTMLEDSEERHKYCPKGEDTWCLYQKTNQEVEKQSHYLDKVFLELLKPTFIRLSDRALLFRCLPGYSQNQNESLNGVVWSKAPKHKFKGPKAIEMAGMSAVMQCKKGAKSRWAVIRAAEIPPGQHSEEGAAKKDNKRLSSSNRAALAIEKKKRKARNVSKAAQEQRDEETEGGPAYLAGAYNEDPLQALSG